jgi:hypothetical protein
MGRKFLVEEVTEPSGSGCGTFIFGIIIVLVLIKMCAH